MSQETIDLIKAKYGYDQPLTIQYFRWLDGLMNGNYGYSIVTKQSIAADLSVRIPNTFKLVLPAYITAYFLAVVLGLLAGSHKNRAADKLIDGFSSVGIAVPSFWFSMLLIFVFGYKLKLLPFVGMNSVGMEASVADFMRHYIMPFSTLVFTFLPANIKFVRSSTLTQFSEDYVLVQQAFGASKREIMFKHVCKNVLLPVVTRLGMALPLLVTGAIITETVFGWPGVGPYFIKAIQGLDYPIVMIILVLSSTLVILGNLLSDILYCLIDPRIREMG
jgi:peptide/nickel transport system permease protein